MSYNLLKGKRGIIFGALNEQSIAWKAAQRIHEEGAEIVLTNTPISLRLGEIQALANQCNAAVIAADATSVEDLENLVDKAIEHFGGEFDFVLHSVAMSANIRKNHSYENANYDFFSKTLDISALSLHKLLTVLLRKNALREWGSVVALSYIAAQRVFEGYNDMADAKALLESVTRNFGFIYGKKRRVRINTISQSPTLTTASKGIDGIIDMFNFADRLSPLGNASADSCANYIVTLFSDLTRQVTMQNLYHDGGFSSVGLTLDMAAVFAKGAAEQL